MNKHPKEYDAIIIGGGIFGLYAAHLLLSKGAKVAVLEKEKDILERASKINQARVHRGYHYPRSFETAQKTAQYYDRFRNDFGFAILKPFKQYYAISKEDSKISADDYALFCRKLRIPLRKVDKSLFFQRDKIDVLFEAEEACFDYLKIKKYFQKQITSDRHVDIYYQSFPVSQKISNSKYVLTLNKDYVLLAAPLVINATYSNINMVNRMFGFEGYDIKYEMCELRLCKMHNGFSNIGLTVMDGPFFSFMPFGDGSVYSLSSVNFTSLDTSCTRPWGITKRIKRKLNGKKAEDLARNYLKNTLDFEYLTSIFEVKPLLISSEEDDSRPTLITIHSQKPYFVSVLAGKIGTIYDLEGCLRELSDNL